MFSLVEARHFRCLKYIVRPLEPFHVIVGPNASGKTTFLDVLAFLGRLVSEGLDAALLERSADFLDLTWLRAQNYFELAVEANIPSKLREEIADKSWDTVRYEVKIGMDAFSKQPSVLSEKVILKTNSVRSSEQRTLFPDVTSEPDTILTSRSSGARTIVSKPDGGNANYNSETHEKAGKGWVWAFPIRNQKSALGYLPDDSSKFPVAIWLRTLLVDGVQTISLNSLLMRRPSPPATSARFKMDGSNLPWVVERLQKQHPENFREWIAHLATALPDVVTVSTWERPEDRHCCLKVHYQSGLEVPSWMVSDGTLRLLALTLPAYLPDFRGVFLIEEPENGIHPRAVETVYQSLSSMYESQVLLATHSQVILSMARAEQVLCFSKTSEGAVDVVRGDQHPNLRDWKQQENLGVLFAAGVLS